MSEFSIYILIFCVYGVLLLINQKINYLDDKLNVILKMEEVKLLIGEDAEKNFEEILKIKKIMEVIDNG